MSNRLPLRISLENIIKKSEFYSVNGSEFFNAEEMKVKLKQGVSDAGSWAGSKIMSGLKYTGGKVGEGLTKALNATSKELMTRLGSNNMVIKNFLDQLKKEDILVEEFDVPSKMVLKITSKGKLDSLSSDLETLIDTIDSVEKYNDELNHYLGKLLSTVFGLMKCKEDDKFLKKCEEFESLKVPELKFKNSTDNGSESECIPGGRHMCFKSKDGEPEYYIRTENIKATSQIYEPKTEELKSFLLKLKSINETYGVIKNINDQYANFLKKWGEDIKAVYSHIHSLDSLSTETKNKVNKILDKYPSCLVFYGSFIPKSVIYLDDYISDSIQFIKKLIKN